MNIRYLKGLWNDNFQPKKDEGNEFQLIQYELRSFPLVNWN